jgi:hypothetical protein
LFSTLRLVAVKAFGDGKALFPTGFVKFFAEYTRFRLQNLPNQSKKWQFPSLKALHRNKSIEQFACKCRDRILRRAIKPMGWLGPKKAHLKKIAPTTVGCWGDF